MKNPFKQPKVEITNMVMVQNPENGEVLVQERVKYWCGISFPGGHIEDNESYYDSAVREVKEETGLDIRNLKPCGLIYWFNTKTKDKYLVHLYKTTDYSGTLIPVTEEGRVFWTKIDAIYDMQCAPNFREYLKVFLDDTISEAFCSWCEDMHPDLSKPNPWGIVYR